jgi:hypothetical protein
MLPSYTATLTSSGSTPWKETAWRVSPFALGIAVYSSIGAWQIDITMDDVTRTFPDPISSAPVVFQSNQLGTGSNLAAGTGNAIGWIITPIAAWRLTAASTGAGVNATAVGLQAGIG